MEPLSKEQIEWGARVGLSMERLAWLASCPKNTLDGRRMSWGAMKTENPMHHLQKMGDCWWFRLRRGKKDIWENFGKDLENAKKMRDARLSVVMLKTK